LKEKQFLERKNATQDNQVAAELRRIEREANRALGVPDVPSVAPIPKSLQIRLPSKSSSAPPPPSQDNEPFKPAYIPIVRAPSQAMYETSTSIVDVSSEQTFQELTTAAAATTTNTTGEAGEWTVVSANESLDLQQESDAASAAMIEAQIAAAQRKKNKSTRNNNNDDDEDSNDDDEEEEEKKGSIISGPRHLEQAIGAISTMAPTFKKRKTGGGGGGGGADRSIRKKVLDDDDDE
jgi:hypothetical protein